MDKPSENRWQNLTVVRGGRAGWFSRLIALIVTVIAGAVLCGLIAVAFPYLSSPSLIKNALGELFTSDNSSQVVSRFILGAAVGAVLTFLLKILRRPRFKKV